MSAQDTTPDPRPISLSPVPAPPGIDPAIFARRLAYEDAQRAKAKRLQMIAVASFTLVDDDHPNGLVIEAGAEISISAFDEARFGGKLRRKAMANPSSSAVADGRAGAGNR